VKDDNLLSPNQQFRKIIIYKHFLGSFFLRRKVSLLKKVKAVSDAFKDFGKKR
jgi:hypothetical protein